MSADVLRRAAALMRERAREAESVIGDSGWVVAGLGWSDPRGYTYTVVGHDQYVCEAVTEEVAVHIAAWSPIVALAVADWLDHEAVISYGTPWGPSAQALAVARAYLGEAS